MTGQQCVTAHWGSDSKSALGSQSLMRSEFNGGSGEASCVPKRFRSVANSWHMQACGLVSNYSTPKGRLMVVV